MITQANPRTFFIDRSDCTDSLIAALAGIEEHLPDEVQVQDLVRIATSTPRSAAIIALLIGVATVETPPIPEVLDPERLADEPPANISDLPAPAVEDERSCPICGASLAGKKANATNCGKSACKNALYRQKKAVVQEAQSNVDSPAIPIPEDTPADERQVEKILDVKKGEFIPRHDLITQVRSGQRQVSELFRKSGNKVFEVAKVGSQIKLIRSHRTL